MKMINPYTPGAGTMPAYLAGRDSLIEDAKSIMDTVDSGYSEQSIIYYGLRGVGKTVLLNKLEEIADEKEFIYEHVEVREKGNFIQQLTSISAKIIRQMSVSEKAKELKKDFIKKATMALQALKMSYNPSTGEVSIGLEGMDDIEEIIITESILEEKLTDLFEELGVIAKKTDKTLCFFIDEMQYLKKDNVEALACAMHKVSQKRLPIMIFGAGLPRVAKDFGDAKSYTERLFHFVEIGGLSKVEVKLAIEKPAEGLSIGYEEDSIKRITEITGGYPYFIQEMCKAIWNKAGCVGKTQIDISLVEDSVAEFYAKLDASFFKSRYDRCTDSERDFVHAMIKCDGLPCNISNVATIMKREVQQISMIRATLINKGIIYSTRHGEIDFTVPQFDEYLKRISDGKLQNANKNTL